MNYVVELKSTTELSHWELSHTLNVLGNTYMKLTMLNEMQKLYNNGANDNDFVIGVKSLDLHINISELDTLIQIPIESEYTILDRKSENAESFWSVFNSLHRPIILYKTQNGYKSLYNSENYLIFKNIDTNSPQWLKTLGKSASIELAKIVFTAITGHYITDFVFEDNTQELIEQNNRAIEQNENILHNQEFMLIEQPENSQGIDLTQEKTKQVIKNMQNFSEDIEIEYYDFINRERENLKNKLKNQLKKTPLKVEDVFTV